MLRTMIAPAMKTSKYGSVLLLALVAVSCNRQECTNTNPVFDHFAPDTKQYRAELAKQIRMRGNRQISYWFDRHAEIDAKEYIVVYAQADSLCAKGYIRVDNWNKIEALRAGELRGYSGAGLRGLKCEMSADTELVFTGLDRIID